MSKALRAPATYGIVVMALALVGCKKGASRYAFRGDEAYPDAVITVGGRPAKEHVVDFKRGELSEHEVATLTCTTPCGTATVTASGGAPNSSGVIVVEFPKPKNAVTLYFDPALVNHQVESPRRTIPAPNASYPAESHLRVVFGDCPRIVKIDGRAVEIPESPRDSYVLVAASRETCFVSGIALYGPLSGYCKAEASDRLTGRDAYVIDRTPSTMFNLLPEQTRARDGCTNVNYLQYCQSSSTGQPAAGTSTPAPMGSAAATPAPAKSPNKKPNAPAPLPPRKKASPDGL